MSLFYYFAFIINLSLSTYGITDFIDTNHPIIINGGTRDSYFGYSIAGRSAFSNSPSKIYIGAPNSTGSGRLFECDLNLEANPGVIRFRCVPNAFSQQPQDFGRCLNPSAGQGYRDEMWLGGSTVAISNSPSDDSVISCGHRWMADSDPIKEIKDRTLNGICFRKRSGEQASSIILPGHGKLCKGVYCSYNQFGFSIAASGSQLLVGVPAYTDYYFKYNERTRQQEGQFVRHKGNAILMNLNSPNQIRFDQCQQDFAMLVDFNSRAPMIGSSDSEYLGYSVAMGSSMAIGSPRGNNLFGYVVEALPNFQWQNTGNRLLQIIKALSGDQLGEYFGSSLAFANLFGDKEDELIVGSPMRNISKSSYDEGCIYIYGKVRNVYELVGNKPLCPGKDSGGRFGSSIANIGDINQNSYDDLAVGAPGADNGIGKVYIFYGNTDFQNPLVISGIQLNQHYGLNLLGFGATLAGKVDLDGNATPDLLIGSWESEQVVIFRTRPKLNLWADFSYLRANKRVDKFQRDDSEITVQICINAMRIPDLDLPLGIQVEGSVDGTGERFQFADSQSRSIQFQLISNASKDWPCRRLNVKLLKELDANDAKEIVFQWKLTYENVFANETNLVTLLPQQGRNDNFKASQFCPRCPVSTNMTFKDSLQISQDTCEKDGNPICTSDLKVTTKIFSPTGKETYEQISGSNEHRILNVDIINRKETAYNPTVNVTWFDDKVVRNVTLIDNNYDCKENYKGLKLLSIGCLKPLHSSKSITLRFKISFENLLAAKNPQKLGIEVSAFPKIFLDQARQSKPIAIEILSDVKLEFRSLSDTRTAISNLDVINYVKTSFEISNMGLSPISDKDVHIEFEIPQKFTDKSGDVHNAIFIYQPILRPNHKMITCKMPGGFSVLTDSKKPQFPNESSNNGSSIDSPVSRSRRNVEESEVQQAQQSSDDKIPKIPKIPSVKGVSLQFDCSRTEWKCVKITCNLGMNAKDLTTIDLTMALNKTVAGTGFMGASRILIKIEGRAWTFDLNENAVWKATSSSELTLKLDNSVPAWVVFVSAIGGLILFLLIAVCLFKCGFFRRKTKENLENLKAKTKQEELMANNFPEQSEVAEEVRD